MTKDEIIEMARQADFCVSEDGSSISTNNSYGVIQYELEAFAKLVAEKEREECALICENYADVDTYQDGIIQDYHSHLIRLRGKE